jgi:hypothetical protein
MGASQDPETQVKLMNAHVVLVGNEKDLSLRRRIIEATYAPTVTLYAPTGVFQGFDKLEAAFDGFLGAFPKGCVFEQGGSAQLQEDLAIQKWVLGKKGEVPLATGVDVCIFTADGKIGKAYVLVDKEVETI